MSRTLLHRLVANDITRVKKSVYFLISLTHELTKLAVLHPMRGFGFLQILMKANNTERLTLSY